MNEIHIFECLDSGLGDRWDSIIWKSEGATRILGGLEWKLNCDFRMPSDGLLAVGNTKCPNDDCQMYRYDLPYLTIPGWKIGTIPDHKLMTDDVRKKWESLPTVAEVVWDLRLCQLVLTFDKQVLDPLFHSPHGRMYLYQPRNLLMISKNVVSADGQDPHHTA